MPLPVIATVSNHPPPDPASVEVHVLPFQRSASRIDVPPVPTAHRSLVERPSMPKIVPLTYPDRSVQVPFFSRTATVLLQPPPPTQACLPTHATA